MAKTKNTKKTDNTCSTIEERPKYAKIPLPKDKGYLEEKAEEALDTVPKIVKKAGKSIDVQFKAVAFTGAIISDEIERNDYARYKAEVVFDMSPVKKRREPIPYLTNSSKRKNRRHSRNYFRRNSRRPDVIIVKNKRFRWPARAGKDHNNVWHEDNLRRVVEVKFPGDQWRTGQEKAYLKIAGGVERFSVVDVKDCSSDDGEKNPVNVPVLAPAPSREDDKVYGRKPAPVRTTRPEMQPVFYEEWFLIPARNAAEYIAEKANQMVASVKAWITEFAAWALQKGRWVFDKAKQVFTYISETGQVIAMWSLAKLKQAWEAIKHFSDMTLEFLKSIDWWQVLLKVAAAGVVIFAVYVGGKVLLAAAVPLAAATAFIVLLNFIHTADQHSQETVFGGQSA